MQNAMVQATYKSTICTLMAVLLLALASVLSASAAEYVLGPDDVLSVTVLRHPELSVPSLTVTADGVIRLQIVGEVSVTGKTVAQVQEFIAGRLRSRLVAPEVNVAVVQQRTAAVFVLGAVKSPGVIPIKPGWRVTEAMAAAGGLMFRPDEVKAVLLRGEKTQFDLDLQAILNVGHAATDLALEPGDVINVTRLSVQISVSGSVLRPGTYLMAAGGGALDAIGLAGGVGSRADTGAVIVESPSGERRKVDLLPALLEGKPVQDPPLQMNDMVIVPARNARVSIIGAVKQPGSFDLDAGVPIRVAALVALAGGLVPRAEMAAGSLFHQNGEVVPLDVNAILVTGTAAANLELAPGDVVSISERTMQVNVVGQVTRPGPQMLPIGSGIAQAVAAAGGVTATSALHEVVLKPAEGPERRIDLYSILVGGKLDQNITLGNGDTVLVPESRAKVAVLGAVKTPGYYALDADNPPTVVQLVAMAGGTLPRARIGDTALIRITEGKPQPIRIDLNRVLNSGKIENDRVAQDRDVIYVPPAKADWDLILRAITSVSVLGGWLGPGL